MNVKNTNIKIYDSKYNNTIMDGEYMYLSKYNKFVFLAFDCMFYGNENIKNESNFI